MTPSISIDVGGGLRLAPFMPGDLPGLEALARGPWGLDDRFLACAPFRRMYFDREDAVFVRAEGAAGVLGYLYLSDVLPGYDAMAHGYGRAMHPARAGRALRAFLDWGAEFFGLHRVSTVHAVANQGATLAAEKAGFEVEGVHKSAGLYAGQWVDMVSLGWLPGRR